MMKLTIKDEFNNTIIATGDNIPIPRVGDRVDMKKYVPAPTVGTVLWDYPEGGDISVTVTVY